MRKSSVRIATILIWWVGLISTVTLSILRNDEFWYGIITFLFVVGRFFMPFASPLLKKVALWALIIAFFTPMFLCTDHGPIDLCLGLTAYLSIAVFVLTVICSDIKIIYRCLFKPDHEDLEEKKPFNIATSLD